jgi:hypothetical protein
MRIGSRATPVGNIVESVLFGQKEKTIMAKKYFALLRVLRGSSFAYFAVKGS